MPTSLLLTSNTVIKAKTVIKIVKIVVHSARFNVAIYSNGNSNVLLMIDSIIYNYKMQICYSCSNNNNNNNYSSRFQALNR